MHHDIDAEISVLGAMMLLPRVVPDVLAILSPEDFFSLSHQRIFRAIRELDSKGQEPDPISVTDLLARQGLLEEAGGRAFIHSLTSATHSAVQAPKHAAIIKRHSLSRRVTQVTRTVLEMQDQKSPEEVIAYIQDALSALEHDTTQDAVPLKDILGDHFAHLERIAQSDRKTAGITSNFIGLDQILSGFEPATLTVLAARPAMGKTALALNMMVNFARNEPTKPVLMFSLEMAKLELTTRLIAAHTRIDSQKLKSANLSEEEWRQVTRAHAELCDLNLYIDDQAALPFPDIRARARRLHRKKGLSAVFVDYLQLVRPSRHYESRVQEVSEVSQGLKNLAKELNVPVIALSQLSREVEKRTDKKPVLSDLRDSGTIEQDSDICVFMYRHDYYYPDEPTGVVELLVRKNRNGPTGDCKLAFTPEYGRFANMPKGGPSATKPQPPADYPRESADRRESEWATESERQVSLI